MKGRNNSVMSRIKAVQPNIIDIGCICHLANLCCAAGVKALPVKVDDLLVDIYFHFHHSAKRKEVFKEFLEFLDVEPMKILRHASTRWLSLQRCVGRTLDLWDPLYSYFNSHAEVEKAGRVKKVAELLNSPEVHLYLFFLDFILVPLNEFNTCTAFQADTAKIGLLHQQMIRLLRKFLSKFISSQIILSSDNITNISLHEDNMLCDQSLAIGPKTRSFLEEQRDEMEPNKVSRFFKSVKSFYVSVVVKMIKKFPFDDKTLQDLAFLSPKQRNTVNPNSVCRILKKCPSLDSEEAQTQLAEEIQDYALSPSCEIPETQDTEQFWGQVCQIIDPFSGKPRFPVLSALAAAMLALPNSNAASERAFSMVRRIHTEFRSELGNDTLCSLLSVKINSDISSKDYTPSNKVLMAARSACVDYNNSVKEKVNSDK